MDKYDGVFFDYTSVMGIISRLSLYIENEEKIIINIKNTLLSLDNYYKGDNSSAISSKKANLTEALDTLLEHKKKYVIYIQNMLDSYMAIDESIYLSYQKKDIS